MSGIKAIETRYAGCHFRSRLEARWAVFFDTLGVRWEYEPQGFEIATGYDDRPTFNYLPDFHLTDLGTFVEVKGTWDRAALERACNAVCPHGSGIPGDLLILGPVPRVDPARSYGDKMPHHASLHFYKGEVMVDWVSFNMGWSSNSPGPYGKPSLLCSWQEENAIWADHGSLIGDVDPDGLLAARAMSVTWISGEMDIKQPLAAYTAARSARFEHGQSGAA